MKKILIIPVTYHSDEALHTFVESVHRAAERVKSKMQVDIEIADNGLDNKGYLGGALPIYNAKAKGYDFVAISNVDLELAEDFFEHLLAVKDTNLGWIAPDIYTEKIDRHENPYMRTRPTKRDFAIWDIIYRSTFIYRLYHGLYLLKSRHTKVHPEGDIYAGHGSFMLFTKHFVTKNSEMHFPGFMYGEEIYLAELTHKAGLRVRYIPTLRIANVGNINTGLINQAQKSQWSKESLRAIYKAFLNERTG